MRKPTVTLTRKENGYFAMKHVRPQRKFEIGDVVTPISDLELCETEHEANKYATPHIVTGLKLNNKHGQGYWEYELDNFSFEKEEDLAWHPWPDAKKVRGFGHILPRSQTRK